MAQTTKELLQASKPDFIAHLEVTINAVETFEQQMVQFDTGIVKTKTIYSKVIAPTREAMDLAIKNYAGKYGALAIKTITPNEYEDATNESKTQI